MNVPSEPDARRSTTSSDGPVTALLTGWTGGDRASLDALIPLVHDELKRLARRYLRSERPNHTIQATALVNEAFVRLADERGIEWHGRTHFFGIVAHLMREILVDYARRRHAERRGGGRTPVGIDTVADQPDRGAGVLAIDQALSDLARIDERKARVAELHLFGGLTAEQAAGALGVSAVTVARDWRFARAWLRRELSR